MAQRQLLEAGPRPLRRRPGAASGQRRSHARTPSPTRSAPLLWALSPVAPTVLQLAVVALWVAGASGRGLCLDARRIGLAQWLAALVMIAYGQSLNAGIFAAIGKVGRGAGCAGGWVGG